MQPTQNNILPPEEYAPSPSPSSTAWTQSPKAALLEGEQSQTSHVSHSSPSSNLGNTWQAEQTQSPPPSPFSTSSSLWEPKPPKPPNLPLPPAPPPPSLASSLQRRKMASKENILETEQQDTPAHVQWQSSGAVWHTYDSTALPQTRIFPQFSKEISGTQSVEQKSLQRSVPQPQSLDPR